jgi:lambda family phage portal protein
MRARAAVELVARHYEAAAAGRRTQGWNRSSVDANAASAQGLANLRSVARDLVRNNAYAKRALRTIVEHTVGWGIAAMLPRTIPNRTRALEAWAAWAGTPACDAEGRQDFAGLQKQVMRTVAESGEALVRRRWRRLEDGLPIPMQLQILEPDYLDTTLDGVGLPGGARIIQGVEFDAIGRRVAYRLFREHPGAQFTNARGYGVSDRIPASEILHVYEPGRAGQVRGVPWFAAVTLRMKDFDEYEDAALMKQKIAACLAVMTTDIDGSAPALGTTASEQPEVDTLGPGMILNLPPGRSVSVVDPPTVSEHAPYAQTQLRAIASGIGVTYEDLTGDYMNLPFSAARMSRIRHWADVDGWRWGMLIPQFCAPAWAWAMQAAAIVGQVQDAPAARWTPPPMPMIEPDKEGIAYQRLIRIGGMTWAEMVRERGYDPDEVLDEIEEWNKKFDAKGVILDSDPRHMSQQGQPTTLQQPKNAPAEMDDADRLLLNGNGHR